MKGDRPIKVKVVEDIDYNVNDRIYKSGEIIEVEEIWGFTNSYAHYYTKRDGEDRYETIDWIPKHMVKIITE